MKEQSMGRILRRIRIEQGMTQEALVEGICTAGYLSRVENGSQIPSRQIYQLLMERLGESGYSYAYWQEEEEKEQTCRELLHALQTWQKEHVDEKLLKLQKMKGAQDIRERQFYGMAHVIWLYMNEAIPQEDYLGCCRTIWESDAQGKTRRRQGMDKIEFAEMSEVQLWILNNLAIGHMWRGEYRESASILLRLCRYGQKSAEDVRLSWSVRAALCHNMAVCLLDGKAQGGSVFLRPGDCHPAKGRRTFFRIICAPPADGSLPDVAGYGCLLSGADLAASPELSSGQGKGKPGTDRKKTMG